jgi:hypothetical protein
VRAVAPMAMYFVTRLGSEGAVFSREITSIEGILRFDRGKLESWMLIQPGGLAEATEDWGNTHPAIRDASHGGPSWYCHPSRGSWATNQRPDLLWVDANGLDEDPAARAVITDQLGFVDSQPGLHFAVDDKGRVRALLDRSA